jgi:hypothetical protein
MSALCCRGDSRENFLAGRTSAIAAVGHAANIRPESASYLTLVCQPTRPAAFRVCRRQQATLSGRSRFFPKADVDPAHLPESGRWTGGARFSASPSALRRYRSSGYRLARSAPGHNRSVSARERSALDRPPSASCPEESDVDSSDRSWWCCGRSILSVPKPAFSYRAAASKNDCLVATHTGPEPHGKRTPIQRLT